LLFADRFHSHLTDTRAERMINTSQGEEIIRIVNQIVEAVDVGFFFQEKTKLDIFMGVLNKLKEEP
jgi:hypothetical protein